MGARQVTNNKVLMIDDDQELLEVLKEHLFEEGLDVITSTYNGDIFSLIELYQPNLIVLDYILYGNNEHGTNGGELCHQIKSNPQTSHIPVILLTAYARVLSSLGTYGSDAFIAKPFDLPTLAKEFKKQLNGHKTAVTT